jgi:hypothetical protein
MTTASETSPFDMLSRLPMSEPQKVLDALIEHLRGEKNWHTLFDALLMKKRQALGLPLVRPTSLKDVPEGQRDEFEKYHIDTAREIGQLLLRDGSIAQAWNYFRAISEPGPVAAAIEALPESAEPDEALVDIALFQGVAPVRGLQMFLKSHGTCSTITALDQQFAQMTPESRAACARVMVRRLYDDLRANVEHDVKRRQPLVAPGGSLKELIAGREFLFAEDNYHIDVSHLNSVVRFGRMLNPTDPELGLVLQLAQYGARLSPQYQYAGNPPFTEFYPAHQRYFQALLGQDREGALAWFRQQIPADGGDTDRQLAAFALVDLLQRLDRHSEALDVALEYLGPAAEEFGLSIPELCAKANRFDTLRNHARERGDLLNFTAGLLAG